MNLSGESVGDGEGGGDGVCGGGGVVKFSEVE